MPLFYALFFLSGFCGLVYEIVWLRLAMAQFGVTAPYVSIFLAVFMSGLGLGSWAAGRAVRRTKKTSAASALRRYAAAELLIGVSSLTVPFVMAAGRRWMDAQLGDAAWGSGAFYGASSACTAVALIPFCACMGATYPLAMAAIERKFAAAKDSFSGLYLANVLGAATGALAAAYVMIEAFGFRGTLLAAGACNALVAVVAATASLQGFDAVGRNVDSTAAPKDTSPVTPALLFLTGFVSMALEVVWSRQFTFLGNSVYVFAIILAVYLFASCAGTFIYRRFLRDEPRAAGVAWAVVGAAALASLVSANPFLPLRGFWRIALGTAPVCAVWGFLTPALIDRWSGGDSRRAGDAYAINVFGCVLGPLAAGFLLLPAMSERSALVLLSLPLFAAGLFVALRARRPSPLYRALTFAAAGAVLIVALSSTFEDFIRGLTSGHMRVERDYQATVIPFGVGMQRGLMVNSIAMTKLTPITKFMAHLPLAALPRMPRRALVICLGMGTTFRSLTSWGIPAVAVELAPGVAKSFDYFHEDAPTVLARPGARLVVDDGRRFLARSPETFDVITMDPAPPMDAAGAGFLYSKEFYAALKQRLAPDGIVQQWIMEPLEPFEISEFAKALKDSFPYIRAYHSVEGWGYHCLASRVPIPPLHAAALLARMPPAAVRDLVEFGPHADGLSQLKAILAAEVPLDSLILPGAAGLSDDRPINEYNFLRTRFPHAAATLLRN